MLRLLAQGQANLAIAHNLRISATTVRSHVSSILVKLGVTNRTQAAMIASEHGLLVSTTGTRPTGAWFDPLQM